MVRTQDIRAVFLTDLTTTEDVYTSNEPISACTHLQDELYQPLLACVASSRTASHAHLIRMISHKIIIVASIELPFFRLTYGVTFEFGMIVQDGVSRDLSFVHIHASPDYIGHFNNLNSSSDRVDTYAGNYIVECKSAERISIQDFRKLTEGKVISRSYVLYDTIVTGLCTFGVQGYVCRGQHFCAVEWNFPNNHAEMSLIERSEEDDSPVSMPHFYL